MATPTMAKWKMALQVQEELQAQLKKDLPLFDDIEHLIKQMRIACEATLFLDFEFATKEKVEVHLWDAHSLINKRYRKMLGHYRTGDQRKHVVERRKLEKRYADFIKTSQFFYKGYIQRLASHFAGMKDLRRIAHRLALSPLSVDERLRVSPKIERLIELSCHATLLRLGDLSRYRNELRTKDRSWEPALAYYSLASDLYPDSGSSHNQMAVIALADANHLDALYHLYRAIAVKEPHPLAKGNLEIEFKKITNAWEKGPYVKRDSEATLILWFVRLHAKFYKGVDFSNREELENEVLHRLAVELKEQSMERTLERFVLINVAAEYFAGERVREHGSKETLQSYTFFLGFNVRVVFLLLQILQPELEDPVDGEELPSGTNASQTKPSRDKITVITRRVLPALRQYSIWLVSRAHIVTGIEDLAVKIHIKELHKMYTDVLTRIANFFPVKDLPEVNYLLEEDETTIGFKPFRDPDLAPECNLYSDEHGLKPRITDPGVERNHPNMEMLARVRDIMLCGLTLAVNSNYPISYCQETGVFIYTEEGLPPTSPINGQRTNPLVVRSAGLQKGLKNASSRYRAAAAALPPPPKQPSDEIESIADSHQSMDTYMHNMVNSLLEPSTKRTVDSNETSYGMHSRTANEVFAPINDNGFQNHRQSFSTPKMLPSLGGIWSSPFTPQANELKPLSPDRPSTARQLSPLQLTSNEQQMQAAVGLDEVSGYARGRRQSWGRPPSQPVSQLLQESLAQQYMPLSMQASSFSDSSSIYVNTPQAENQNLGGGMSRGPLFGTYGNSTTTTYAGASDFDRTTMLQSSIWNGSQPAGWQGYQTTPPGGQGG